MPSDAKPDPDSAPPEWTRDAPRSKDAGSGGSGRRRVRRKVRRPSGDTEDRWERHARPSERSSFPSYLMTGIICFSLGMLTTYFLLNPPLRVDPPEPRKPPKSLAINLEPQISAEEVLERRERAIATHRKAIPIIDTFLTATDPAELTAILRPTPGLSYNLTRYDAERTRMAEIDRDIATRIASKDAFTGVPVLFANGETRTAWFEHVGDDDLLLDLDSFLGCGDLSLQELERTIPDQPARIRGFARILPRKAGSDDNSPELLALRDASRQTLLLLQIDAHSSISDPVLKQLRESPRQHQILLDVARSPSPTEQSRLRVVKIHALHWLYVPGFQLAPEPPTEPDDTP